MRKGETVRETTGGVAGGRDGQGGRKPEGYSQGSSALRLPEGGPPLEDVLK